MDREEDISDDFMQNIELLEKTEQNLEEILDGLINIQIDLEGILAYQHAITRKLKALLEKK